MSSSALKAFAQALADTAGGSKKGGSGRALNESAQFHVVTVPRDEYYDGLRGANPGFTEEELDIIYKTYIKMLKTHEKSTIANIEKAQKSGKFKGRGKNAPLVDFSDNALVIQRLYEIRDSRRTQGVESFIGAGYDTLRKMKGTNLVSKVLPLLQGRKKEDLKQIGGMGDTGVQFEHGGGGLAGVGVRANLAKQQFAATRQGMAAEEQKAVDNILNSEDILKVSVDRNLKVSSDGLFLLEHAVELQAIDARLNQQASNTFETAAENALKKVGGLAKLKGSLSMEEALEQVLFHAFTHALKGTGATVRISGAPRRKAYKASSKGKGEKKSGQKVNVPEMSVTGAMEVAKEKRKRDGRKKRSPASTPIQLIGAINKNLPAAVRSEMGAPRLENRTGTFADSVKVTSVMQPSAGLPAIEYTYQKDPYEVFEMGRGNKSWATPERDPRNVIEMSIRKAAAELAVNKFMLRRV